MAPSRKEERRVLEAVDRFIQTAMAISLLEGEGREAEAAKARQMLQELTFLVLPFLEGRKDLVTEMIRQLVMQRLPSPKVLESFGDFKDVLEGLLVSCPAAELLEDGPAGPEAPVTGEDSGEGAVSAGNTVVPVPAPCKQKGESGGGVQPEPEPEPEDPVVRSLQRVFPGERVVKNHALRGVTLAYYLPGRNLALEVAGEVDRQAERKAYLCRQQGILLVTVSPQQAGYWREMARCIRRAMGSAKDVVDT